MGPSQVALTAGRRDRAVQVFDCPDLPLQPRFLCDRDLKAAAVLTLDGIQHREPVFDRLQPPRVGVEGFRVPAKLGRDVGDLLLHGSQPRRLGRQSWIQVGR